MFSILAKSKGSILHDVVDEKVDGTWVQVKALREDISLLGFTPLAEIHGRFDVSWNKNVKYRRLLEVSKKLCLKKGIRMFHCLLIVWKISLFSMSFSHDPVIRMFHCLLVLNISLLFMSSSHGPVIRMFHCLFTVLKISLFSMSFSYDPVIGMFHCLIVFKVSMF